MKKIVTFALCLVMLFMLTACATKTAFEVACEQLDEMTNFRTIERDQQYIADLESAYSKKNITVGYQKVMEFRTETAFVHVVQFADTATAKSFYETMMASDCGYDVIYHEDIAVYGYNASTYLEQINF